MYRGEQPEKPELTYKQVGDYDQRQRLRQMGADHQPNGKSTGSDRSAQDARHDEVGGHDEQHPISGEGDRERRDRIQLELFPSVEQQIEELEEAEEMKTSAFFMSQLDMIMFSHADPESTRESIVSISITWNIRQ